MDVKTRIERALDAAVAHCETADAPPGLAGALRYAVFPGGQRIRPRLTLAVAMACGDDRPDVTDAAAAAIEILHCASLVHDDLPTFDDAATRRGKPSLHRAFSEPLAVLTGDAMIVLAFETLARVGVEAGERLVPLLLTLGRSTGMPYGICAGQAWEGEQKIDLSAYQQAKTGSLFAGATAAGAVAAGYDPVPWRLLGERLGEAYQCADDICDVAADPEKIGKPIGQDEVHHRPSAARELGIDGAKKRLEKLVKAAIDAVPECPGRDELRKSILAQASGFLPQHVKERAA
jgi:geranylgeranyl diphosphate synthase type II